MVMIIFKFVNAIWIEAENLTEKDMGLLIDKDEKIMYVWEGKYISPKISMMAKEALSRKKAEYPFYKVHLIKNESPDHIKEMLTSIINKSEKEELAEYNKIAKLDLLQKILALFIFLLLLFAVIRLSITLNFNEFSISAQLNELFLFDSDYSRFMQINLILNIISLILLISLEILYLLSKSVLNIICTNMSIILLIYHIIWKWNFQGSIIILGMASLILIPTLFLNSKKKITNI
ncbi:hypothetical protein DSAG12_01827 [Promethearchaeum syntrophicum]|uniref:Uncharacterized protein n=1 Tax=Promethearchaeum syntrophicum TaxID=2594042 RepID=A0A5B9D9V5_9ARCH|nr:hypothetical protein [Candidatus Prometheoarchaeum syntrophicum]QEE15999.1 hypothetical protein DSAG12_01827 [Candidatus Prometheoarchaeum syntrophicum]